MNDEINTLEVQRQRLKTAVVVLRMPESIAGECLARRTARLERDLVRDKAEEELIKVQFNPLNAELNTICHLLILLGDLKFMGMCIASIFQYISNKLQHYTVYLYLETALYVLGGTSNHHQERIQLYLQHLLFVTPLLLSAAIVEELELV
jgi:hypothetical protein